MEVHRHGVEKEEEQKNLTSAWKQKPRYGEAVPARPQQLRVLGRGAGVTPTNLTNSTAPRDDDTGDASIAPAPGQSQAHAHVDEGASSSEIANHRRRFSTRSREVAICKRRKRSTEPRGQIDRSSRGGSDGIGGENRGARRWPEHGGGHGGDAIAMRVARARVRSRVREESVRVTIMEYTFPKRTLRKVDGWLGDYEGPLTDLLRGMLKELHCETRIPVLKYIYYDGEIEEKGTDSISLDLEMGFSKPSQYEEGESSGVKKKKKKKKMKGQGEMALVETEDARREREAKEKEEADAAARAENAPPPPHPMMHPDFQQYMRAMEEDRRRYQESQNKNMQDFFTHVINDRGNEGKGVTLSDFQNARPLPFASAPEPMDAEDWLMDTERKLKTVGCNDEEKIRYATYLLSGPAASWWENLVAVHPPEKVFTWEEFKKKFRDAHVSESVVALKKREFDELNQNTAPIMQYVRDFNRLSRYAPEEVDTEEKRKKRFMKGMNPYMKMQLRLARTAEFQELIDSAITFEDDYRQVQEDRRKRARIEPRKYPVSKPTPDRSFKPRFRPTGNQYNRGGQNQNPKSQIICNNCGQRGHIKGVSETQDHLLWLWTGRTHEA
ncbi:hypothetical protein QYE76_053042 [Lolium multiflorum]|uniref:Retrotransposon gag domain-containing protein n=1 Tax=Lolium multiflorum TaxID=4521 RepID=A0AAD8WLL0_LOLMU|nr:hypothetical protein QYE76_053042 [Lolium multiflorum]